MSLSLNDVWFLLLGAVLTGYGILDGFDFGVGILHPLSGTDGERRIFLNSIGPLWDGNEVWLVVFGGALFAAFPEAYATLLSGFYFIFILLLFALIMRAVSIEFRSKKDSKWWRDFWDVSFFISSITAPFLFGVMAGNAFLGLPIGADGEMRVGFSQLFRPYPILTGLFAISICAMHGSIFLYLKTEGDTQKKLKNWMWHTFGVFIVMYMLATIATLVFVSEARHHLEKMPWTWAIVVFNVLAIANIPRAIFLEKPIYAFLSSASTITALTMLFGSAIYPNLLTSSSDPRFSLTVWNAASSNATLKIMLICAAIGMPFIFAYTLIVHWVFRGKVKLGKFSY